MDKHNKNNKKKAKNSSTAPALPSVPANAPELVLGKKEAKTITGGKFKSDTGGSRPDSGTSK